MDLARLIIIKPVADGYIYRTPNPWVFGSGQHYFLNEHQKIELLQMISASSRQVLWVTGMSWVALFALLTLGTFTWTDRADHPTLRNVLVLAALIVSLYAALLISRQILSRRLQPLLAVLPSSSERITRSDMRQTDPAVLMSRSRLNVLSVCLFLMPILLVAILISRAVDMHEETHEPMSQAIYSANADFGWVIAAYILFWVAALLIRNKVSTAYRASEQDPR